MVGVKERILIEMAINFKIDIFLSALQHSDPDYTSGATTSCQVEPECSLHVEPAQNPFELITDMVCFVATSFERLSSRRCNFNTDSCVGLS